MSALELWAGVECTVNRVGDLWHNQLERTGHARRPDDIERLAGLGVRAVRYPLIWEISGGLGRPDWTFGDARLNRLRACGLTPIVGLVHHGSGPDGTHLLDPAFPALLARFARAAAERYPWVLDWTPINEPLTTARFSALYGHWYPHVRDTASFVRATLIQTQATIQAMDAIRSIIPKARLVQTEEMGRIRGTTVVAEQVRHENHRRLLSLDLLAGRVDGDHPLYRYLIKHGATPEELAELAAHACHPDLIGINYYLTSDRYLDHRLDRYPASYHGGNGQQAYADVEAVRVSEITGHHALLHEMWERYRRPVAFTEVHLGCTREEQLRWLHEAWQAARRARTEGVDVRAVTVWSAFGACDWNSLVTCDAGHYEPGAFDVRGSRPRPTAIARMAAACPRGTLYDHPVLATPGWWRRPTRFLYHPQRRRADTLTGRPILVTGATGTLGRAFGRICALRGLAHRLTSRHEVDIADPAQVARMLDELQPWAVVNTAGYVRVDEAEDDVERCHRENVQGPARLAEACAERGVALVSFSSDLVFDGRTRRPYRESDSSAPLNVYGQSKALAEQRILLCHSRALIIRTSAFFGPWDPHNFVTQTLAALAAGRPTLAAADLVISPTYVPDLVNASLDLLIDEEHGIWHVANPGAVTWADLGRSAARSAGLDAGLVEGIPASEMALAAPRPAFSALGTERGYLLPAWEDALMRYVQEVDAACAPFLQEAAVCVS